MTARRANHVATWACLLLCLTVAFELRQPWLRLGPLVVTNLELLAAAALGLWLLSLLAGRRWPRVPVGVAWPLIAWLAVAWLAALAAPQFQSQALKFCARMTVGLLAGWAVYDLARASGQQQAMGRALALGAVGLALVGLAEIVGLGPVAAWLDHFKAAPSRVGQLLRLSATQNSANTTAMLLELSVPLVLAWLLAGRRRAFQVAIGLALAAMLAAVILTLSRAGLATLLAALVLMAWLAAVVRHWRLVYASLAAATGLIAIAGLLALLNPLLLQRASLDSEQDWYRVDYQAPAALDLRPGETRVVRVAVTNHGRIVWSPQGEHAVELGYHVYAPGGAELVVPALRSPLPHRVQPGETAQVDAQFTAPTAPGVYRLEWDMVQEDVTWFSWKGAATGLTTVTVPGDPAVTGPAEPPEIAARGVDTVAPLGRVQLWGIAVRMFLERPLLGIGPDNFRLTYGTFAGLDQWDNRVHTNNLYLEWLVSTGILGAAAFLWFAWRLAAASARSILVPGPGMTASERAWRIALCGSLAAWFGHGLLDSFFAFNATLLAFGIIAGLALAAADSDGRAGATVAA